jgi:hypothetical protein
MQLTRRFRIPALFCALAVLLCELISHPSANMWICDDGSYILSAHTLASTGHIVYVGWAAAMLGWQLYLGAAFIKLFGFSFTTVRSCTLLVAMAVAFVLQRTLVRAGITERNATLGTLALVLSPLYLMLSVTFMSDIHGLFAIVLCLYGCLHALQSSTSRAAIFWLCFAVTTNALCGTSRQIAWLGLLVMVPSTLWLLRAQRRVVLAGAAATLAGALFIFGCLHWLKQQPYSLSEPLLPSTFPLAHTLGELTGFFLDIPFLLLPIVALFFSGIRKSRPRVLAALFLVYLLVGIHPRHPHQIFLLEPTVGDWIGIHGIFEGLILKGPLPLFLPTGVQALLTIASFGGLLCLVALLLSPRKTPPAPEPAPEPSPEPSPAALSWKQLGVLLLPFTFAYILLLIPRAATIDLNASAGIVDRYALALLVVALLFLIRFYQDRIQSQLPLASLLMIGIMAIYGIAVTHNLFSLYRARVVMAAELRAAGVPDTSVDNGWEFNFGVQLQHADHINESMIVNPPHAYTPRPPLPPGACPVWFYDDTPVIQPLYGISFDPHACYGLAPFAPVHYSRWLASKPGTLYVVNYTAPPNP